MIHVSSTNNRSDLFKGALKPYIVFLIFHVCWKFHPIFITSTPVMKVLVQELHIYNKWLIKCSVLGKKYLEVSGPNKRQGHFKRTAEQAEKKDFRNQFCKEFWKNFCEFEKNLFVHHPGLIKRLVQTSTNLKAIAFQNGTGNIIGH